MRKFALLAFTCTLLLSPTSPPPSRETFWSAAANFMSLSSPSDIVSFQPLTEKGGLYLGIAGDVVSFPHRLGINVETSWRYKQGNYYGYENYRPFFTDANLLFQPKINKKMGLEFMAGVGIASNRFYILQSCGSPGCINFTSSNHFMEDFGAGFRYYVWHHLPHVFVRPEAHYYHVQNNQGFNSGNVFRVGASIGYTFGK